MSEELRTLQSGTDTSGLANNEATPPTIVLNEWIHPLIKNANVVATKGHTARWVKMNDVGSPAGSFSSGWPEGGNQHGSDGTAYWTGVGVTADHVAYVGSGVVSDEFRKDLANDEYLERLSMDAAKQRLARAVQVAVETDALSVNVGATATNATVGAAMSQLADPAFNSRTAFYCDYITWSDTLVALGAEVNTDASARDNGLLGYYAGYPVWAVHHYVPNPAKLCYFGDLKASIGIGLGEQRVKWFEKPATDEWLVNAIIRAGLAWIGTYTTAANMPGGSLKSMVKLNFA